MSVYERQYTIEHAEDAFERILLSVHQAQPVSCHLTTIVAAILDFENMSAYERYIFALIMRLPHFRGFLKNLQKKRAFLGSLIMRYFLSAFQSPHNERTMSAH